MEGAGLFPAAGSVAPTTGILARLSSFHLKTEEPSACDLGHFGLFPSYLASWK